MSLTARRPLGQVQIVAVIALLVAAFLIEMSFSNAPFREALENPSRPRQLAAASQEAVRAVIRFPLVQTRVAIATPAAWWPLVVVTLVLLVIAAGTNSNAPRPPTTVHTLTMTAVCVGLLVWMLRGGSFDWTRQDWQKEWTYFSAWQEALRGGELPWMLRTGMQGTEQLLANPESMFGPQVLLLLWLSIPTVALVNLVVYATAGVWACRLLAREIGLDSLTACAFMFVFVMNGHITSHLAVGHIQWAAYFLLPFVFLFIVRAAKDHQQPLRHAAGLALVLFAMLMTGGWHVFVWAVLITALFVVLSPSRWRFGFLAAALTAGVMAFRVLPGVMVFGGGTNEFISGYPSVAVGVNALVGSAVAAEGGLTWWEYDAFLGWIGFAIVCVGLTRSWRDDASLRILAIPALVMIVLSLRDFYFRTLFQLPGFVSERVSSRLAIVGVLIFLLLGFQQLAASSAARGRSRWYYGAVFGGGLLMVLQLVLHAEAIRPSGGALIVPTLTAIKPIEPERSYRYSVAAGVAISAVTAGYALRIVTRRNHPVA